MEPELLAKGVALALLAVLLLPHIIRHGRRSRRAPAARAPPDLACAG
jgi:hypothetical protein